MATAAVDQTGIVFDVERYSTHDGPGTRTTVFLKGCYLRCAWCHNPESMNGRPELMYDADRCIACYECFAACQHGALTLTDDQGALTADDLARRKAAHEPVTGRVHKPGRCVRCGDCVEACYAAALELVGEERSVDDVLADVTADRQFYVGSGGGVTVSGGEPLYQAPFAAALLAGCQREGLHTALDTTAFGHWERLASVVNHADLVLLDLKTMDPAVHQAYTGVSNASILANARTLGRMMAHRLAREPEQNYGVWVRIPVIPGVNDDEANLRATARFARNEIGPAVRAIELLGYHGLGGAKLQRLGQESRMTDVAPLSKTRLAERASWVEEETAGSGIAVRFR